MRWTEPSLSRRQVLTLAAGAGLSTALTACGVRTTGGGSTQITPASHIHIPKSGANLPRGNVSFNWLDNGEGLRALFEKPFFKAYQKAHPNINVTYDGTTWERIDQVLPLAVKNDTAPDVFVTPNNVPTQTAVEQGWVAPIEDVVPDFAAWKAKYPGDAFVPGVHTFNGKVYTWPYASNKRYGQLLFYDEEYLKAAGYDPTSKPLTWDEFRTAAKKVTQRGKGAYYGFMGPGASLGSISLTLAQVAGLPGGDGSAAGGGNSGFDAFDWKTGRYTYDDPRVLAAIELLLAIKSDGSFFPGSMSLTQTPARARMPQRVAGMIFDGPWDIPAWPAVDPSYKFGIGMPPIPNDRKWHTTPYQETGTGMTFISARTHNPSIAGDIFHYIGSPQGQTEMVIFSDGNLLSVMPEVNQAANASGLLSARGKTAAQLADQLLRLAPLPQVRNPATGAIQMKAVKPAFSDIVLGLFTGQVTDAKAALANLTQQSNQNFDQAVEAARAKGLNVTQDDWIFPNWDPTKDYGPSDYKALHS